MRGTLLKEYVMGLLTRSPRLTFMALHGRLAEQVPRLARRETHKAVSSLVAEGSLRYTQRFGFSELERNYQQLCRISPRIWLAPAEMNPPAPPEGVMIKLLSGAAFGCGDHPTTRLALRAVDKAISQRKITGAALDIGTGSGVLAMAAVALGMQSSIALDVDPLACYEARSNVQCNGLGEYVTVSDQPIASLTHPPFDLIMANLRPPTLKMLFGRMRVLTAAGGLWVLSGFRCQEMPSLRPFAQGEGESILWEENEADWGVWLMERRSGH